MVWFRVVFHDLSCFHCGLRRSADFMINFSGNVFSYVNSNEYVVKVNHSKAMWLVNKVNNKIKVWVCTQTKVDFPDPQC